MEEKETENQMLIENIKNKKNVIIKEFIKNNPKKLEEILDIQGNTFLHWCSKTENIYLIEFLINNSIYFIEKNIIIPINLQSYYFFNILL